MAKLDVNKLDDDGIKNLGYAICMQAAVDYRKSILNKIKGKKEDGIQSPETYEAFFNSEWFKELSGIKNGEAVIKHIRKNKDKKIEKFDFSG